MKAGVLLFFGILLWGSCTKSDDLSSCLEDKIAATSDLRAVYRVKVDGEYGYWFNTGHVEFDGTEFIYDKDCNQICNYCGFCVKPICLDDFPSYGSNEWEQVWKKP